MISWLYLYLTSYCPDMFQLNHFIPKCIVDCGDDLWIWLWVGMTFGQGHGLLIITTAMRIGMSLPFLWFRNSYNKKEHEVSRIYTLVSLTLISPTHALSS
jgi:hypothetical protein